MSNRPIPSEVQIKYGSPFVNCFGRVEREYAAAIYVEACKRRGDTWQPINPTMFGETLIELAKDVEGPWWAKSIIALRLVPDMLWLVDAGFFSRGEEESVFPTDAFFEKIDRPGIIRRVCSAARPRPSNHQGSWVHPLAQEVGDQEDGYPGGDIVRYRCPVCGTTWKAELPQ